VAADAIREESMRRDIYRNPTVSLAFVRRVVCRVTVDGAVVKPGTYELAAGTSTLAAALAAAGGLTKEATQFVEIQNPASNGLPPGPARPGETAVHQVGNPATGEGLAPRTGDGLVRVDLSGALRNRGANGSVNHYLRDGAVVTVVKTPQRYVTVMGQTGINKVLPLAPERETRLLDALAEVGGPKYSMWIADKVKVIRRVPDSDDTITIVASMRGAKKNNRENLLLASGDVVSVEENPLTFTMDTVSRILGMGVTATQAAYYAR
jgi:protein involved in polysaccharide export with SLBB domain